MKTPIKLYGKKSIALLGIVAFLAVFAVVNQPAKADNCDGSGLSAQILSDGTSGGGATANIQNASGCSYSVGLASYNGSLFDSGTATIPAYQVIELHASVPCSSTYEVDVFRGSVLSAPSYGSNLLTRAGNLNNNGCPASNNPTTSTAPAANTGSGSGSTGCSSIMTDVTGTIVSTGSPATARVVNHSDCYYRIGLASYKQYSTGSDWISSQVKFNDMNVVIGPHQTLDTDTLHVSVPDCHYQIDLVEGYPITPPNYGGAGHALLDAQFGGGALCGSNPTPTPVTPPGNQKPIGSLDAARCDLIGGWAVDMDSPTASINVSIYSDGTLLSNVSANRSDRTDVNTALGITGNHGFFMGTPASLKDGNNHSIKAVAYDAQTGEAVTIAGSPLNLNCPATQTPTPTPAIVCNNGQLPNPPAGCNYQQVGTDANSCPIRILVCQNGNSVNNSYNTTNSSNIYQYGTNNLAQVNQSGAYSGNQTNYGYIYGAAATPTPYPTYTPMPTLLSIQKLGEDVSLGQTVGQTAFVVRPGDTVEFDLTVIAPQNTNLTNVVVADPLPAGLSYNAGSTLFGSTHIGDGIVGNGVNIGSLSAGQQVQLHFFATVSGSAARGQRFINISNARADNIGQVNSNQVILTVTNGVVAGALHVKTGAGADTSMAFAFFGSLSAAGWYLKRKGLVSLIKLS